LSSGMVGCCCQASGIIIMTASCSVRPVISRNSSALSNVPESEQSGSMMGKSFFSSGPNRSLCSTPSRACIQLMFPRSVLISPLWHMKRLGWARSHEGNVLVLNREWTMARWLL